MTVGHLIKSAFFRHLNARFSSNFPPGEYQVISTLPKMSQTPWKHKKIYLYLFTWGNRWLGGICSSPRRRPKVTWEGQEPKQRSCFPFSQNRKASTLLDWKQSGTSSTNIQFLWAPSPGAPVNLLASAINQRDIIREKTNLLICFVNKAAWRSGRALGSTCHAARSHVDGLRVGVNLAVHRRRSEAKLLDKSH